MGLEERTHEQPGRGPSVRMRAPTGVRWSASASIASALGIAAGLLIDWFPVAASKQAKPIDTLWDVLLIASVPVFVLVDDGRAVLGLEVPHAPGRGADLDGPPIHGNTRLEVIWTAIPAILLVGLCTYAFVVLEDVEAGRGQPDEGPRRRRAVRLDLLLPAAAARRSPRTQLHLPINRPVKFTIQSKDVLHDFWVPAFRMKKDAVPGIDVTYRVTPNRIGAYPIVCAELCGLGHAAMRADAHVVEPQATFDTLARRSSASRPAAAPAAAAAAAAAQRRRQGALHVSATAAAPATRSPTPAPTARSGPNLDKVLKGKDAAFIKQSIVDPDAEIAEGLSGRHHAARTSARRCGRPRSMRW